MTNPRQPPIYRRLRERANTMITGGEHEYTRYGFREIIDKRTGREGAVPNGQEYAVGRAP